MVKYHQIFRISIPKREGCTHFYRTGKIIGRFFRSSVNCVVTPLTLWRIFRIHYENCCFYYENRLPIPGKIRIAAQRP